MKIKSLESNKGQIPNIPKNPRFIKDERFKILVKSIQDFPKMMELRPIVFVTNEKKNVVIGGNMRLKALIELGYKDIPENWAKDATKLSDEEIREFTIKDNVDSGSDDWDLIANEWNADQLKDWGMFLPESQSNDEKVEPKKFIDEFNEIKNQDAQFPIVPEFLEKHECFIIPVSNEIDENFIRNIFGLNKNFESRDGKKRKSNVISVENVRTNFHSRS